MCRNEILSVTKACGRETLYKQEDISSKPNSHTAEKKDYNIFSVEEV